MRQGAIDPPYPGFFGSARNEIKHSPGEFPAQTMVGFLGGFAIRGHKRGGPPVACLLEKEEHLVLPGGVDAFSPPWF